MTMTTTMTTNTPDTFSTIPPHNVASSNYLQVARIFKLIRPTHTSTSRSCIMPQKLHQTAIARLRRKSTRTHLGEIFLQISDLLVVQGPRHQLQRQFLEGVGVSEVHQVGQRPFRELPPPTAGVVVVEPGVMLCLHSSIKKKRS